MKKLFCAGALCCAMLLTGCQTPPPPPVPDPVHVEYDKTLNPAHVREPSAAFYDENRGGAALRKTETSHVLWNSHLEPDPELERQHQAALEAAELKKKQAAKEAARKKALAAKRAKNKASGKAAVKDRSVYAKSAPKEVREETVVPVTVQPTKTQAK